MMKNSFWCLKKSVSVAESTVRAVLYFQVFFQVDLGRNPLKGQSCLCWQQLAGADEAPL